MSTLLDDIVDKYTSPSNREDMAIVKFFMSLGGNHDVKSFFESVTHLNIQNVADYYYFGTDQEIWDRSKCFPGCLSPWGKLYTEYSVHRQRSTVTGDIRFPAFRYGILAITRDVRENSGRPIGCRVDFMISATIWFGIPRRQLLGPLIIHYGITEQGEHVPFAEKGWLVVQGSMAQSMLGSKNYEEMGGICNPLFLAFSLCNCRNVSVKDYLTSSSHIHKREGKNRVCVRVKKTLILEPFKAVQRTESVKYPGQGLIHAFHICRGHFKSYNEKPLFGKLTGRFWWPQHSRGSNAVGMIDKDYVVTYPLDLEAVGGTDSQRA